MNRVIASHARLRARSTLHVHYLALRSVGSIASDAFPAQPTWSIRTYLDASREAALAHPPVSTETVVHVAALSRLEVTPGTAVFDRLARDLNSMAALMQNVAVVAKDLPALNTPAVDDEVAEERRRDLRIDIAAPPAARASAADTTGPVTDDSTEGPSPSQSLLQHAPQRHGDYVAVPKFVDA